MKTALTLKTRVLPGHRVEFTAPELQEGEEVEVTVVSPAKPKSEGGVADYLESLTPIERTAEEWAEIEREFQQERRSWDR